MSESQQGIGLSSYRQGLSGNPPESPDLCIAELPNHEKLILQTRYLNAPVLGALNPVLGLELPTTPNTSRSAHLTVLWLAATKWLIMGPSLGSGELKLQLAAALSGVPHLISDYSDARTGIEVSGRQARTVLSRVCPLDLHPRTFSAGQCAQSIIARAPLLLHQADELPAFHLYVDRSLFAYAWAWLVDAGSEFKANIGKS